MAKKIDQLGNVSDVKDLKKIAVKLDKLAAKAKRTGKPVKQADGLGLFFIAKPEGACGWRLRYTVHGKEKLLSLGAYPAYSLAEARERRDAQVLLLKRGQDPSVLRKREKIAATRSQVTTVEVIAAEWLAKQTHLSAETHKTAAARLRDFVIPHIGKEPIESVDSVQLLWLLEKIEHMYDTTKKVRGLLGQIWRYAVLRKYVTHDITGALKGALKKRGKRAKKHFAALTTPKEVGGLLRAIDGYKGQATTLYALRLTPYLFQRPGELRAMEWSEIHFKEKLWRIPGKKMKMGIDHLVPLSRQAIVLLREVQALNGNGKFVFPSMRGGHRPLSENTVNGALRTLGFADVHTAHGFRHCAATILNEAGYNRDWIEAQLSHQDEDEVRSAYNNAEYLQGRTEMMQWYADKLDELRADTGDDGESSIKPRAKVVPIRATAAA